MHIIEIIHEWKREGDEERRVVRGDSGFLNNFILKIRNSVKILAISGV